jgi:uncharacterized membrane protein YciS (DUF1049 family)
MNTLKGTLFLVGLFTAMMVIGWLIKRMEQKHRQREKMKALVQLIDSDPLQIYKKDDDIAR